MRAVKIQFGVEWPRESKRYKSGEQTLQSLGLIINLIFIETFVEHSFIIEIIFCFMSK